MIHDSQLADISPVPGFHNQVSADGLVRAINVDADMVMFYPTANSRNHGVTFGRPVMVLAALMTAPPWPILSTLQKDYHAAVLAYCHPQ